MEVGREPLKVVGARSDGPTARDEQDRHERGPDEQLHLTPLPDPHAVIASGTRPTLRRPIACRQRIITCLGRRENVPMQGPLVTEYPLRLITMPLAGWGGTLKRARCAPQEGGRHLESSEDEDNGSDHRAVRRPGSVPRVRRVARAGGSGPPNDRHLHPRHGHRGEYRGHHHGGQLLLRRRLVCRDCRHLRGWRCGDPWRRHRHHHRHDGAMRRRYWRSNGFDDRGIRERRGCWLVHGDLSGSAHRGCREWCGRRHRDGHGDELLRYYIGADQRDRRHAYRAEQHQHDRHRPEHDDRSWHDHRHEHGSARPWPRSPLPLQRRRSPRSTQRAAPWGPAL